MSGSDSQTPDTTCKTLQLEKHLTLWLGHLLSGWCIDNHDGSKLCQPPQLLDACTKKNVVPRFVVPKLYPQVWTVAAVAMYISVFFLQHNGGLVAAKSNKLHAKREGPLGWPAFGCRILAGFEMHSGGAIPAKVVPKSSVVKKDSFFNAPLPHRALRNSIATGLDEDSWGTKCIPISYCILITGTNAVEIQALAISCHKEQGMDLLGSLYSKGHWHHRCLETLEVDENEILTLEIVILFGVHVQLLECDIFDHGDLFVRSSIWTVRGLSWSLLCYTSPKTWLVTKPFAFILVLGTFWRVVRRMFRGGQPQVGEMIKGAMIKKTHRAPSCCGAGTGKGNVRTLSSSPSGRFSRQLWPDGQGRNHRKRHFGIMYWRCPIGFLGFSRLMIRLIRFGENPAHGNITLPRRNASSFWGQDQESQWLCAGRIPIGHQWLARERIIDGATSIWWGFRA